MGNRDEVEVVVIEPAGARGDVAAAVAGIDHDGLGPGAARPGVPRHPQLIAGRMYATVAASLPLSKALSLEPVT